MQRPFGFHEAVLPLELCLRIVAVAGFEDWIRAWRSVSIEMARGPEWFSDASPWSRITIVDSNNCWTSQHLQRAIDMVGSTIEVSLHSPAPPILLLMPGAYQGPITVTRSMSLIGWGRNGAVSLVSNSSTAAPDAWLHLACLSGLAVHNLTVDVESSRGCWALCVTLGHPVLSGCSFKGGGIVLRAGAPIVKHCLIDGSDGVGVLVEHSCSKTASGKQAVLENCIVQCARTDGIYLDGFAVIHGCTIQKNGRHGLYTSLAGALPSMLGERNSFHENGQRVDWGQDVYEDSELFTIDFCM